MLNATGSSGGDWRLELVPPVLIPSRPARLTATFTPHRALVSRGVRALLVATETYRYQETEIGAGPDGTPQHRSIARTGREEVGRLEATLAGPGQLAAGAPVTWTWDLHVPDLGPATFEGEVLRCDWELAVTVDVPHAFDAEVRLPVHIAQPTALLRAGVVNSGQYGLFDEAPANVDVHPAQIRLAPVPLCLAEPFSGSVTLETEAPVSVQEVRLELRVHVEVTHRGGLREEITVARGHLPMDATTFGGPLATHPFTGDPPDKWLPTIDLPHGKARARFHVILAESWAPDTHYTRDVALCTTTEV
jgi:hypothetical protein